MLLIALSAVIIVFGVVSSANALTITPATTPQWTGNQTNNNEVLAAIYTIMGSVLPELYKADVPPAVPSESGPFQNSYQTTFSNSPSDPQDATIVYGGDPLPYITASPLYLLVKDGSATPAWYLFGLNYTGAPNWDGKEDLELRGFWPDTGAISHVALYGTAAVPEPITLLLLGLGLVGVAGARRFKK